MRQKLMIGAAALAIVAGTGSAYAWDVTSDPDATMTEQQKLGPNERTHMLPGGGYVTQRYGHAGRIATAPYAYGYYNGPYAYAPGPSVSVGVGW